MSNEFQCTRCGTTIALHDDHTEIVRRDFIGEPQPSQVEHLCDTCWDEYQTFLDGT